MKTLKFTLAIFAAVLFTAMNVSAAARVQVIHNSADQAASVVDIYLNGEKLIDDFAFRTASPFIDAPAGVNLNIAVAGANSISVSDAIWANDYMLEDGKTYVLIANGIVSPDGYEPNVPFDIHVFDMGMERATSRSNTDVLVFHGSTDAPTVDVLEIGRGAGTLTNNLSFGDFAGYLELPTADYVLDIRDESGENSVVSYAAPLETLGLNGAALVAVASGFLNPDNNSNGEAFGLWVALPTGGELVELPVFESGTARVQVIHNSADVAAGMVDIWLNDEMLIDDFSFRTASPFIDAPAGVNLNIAVAGPNSNSSSEALWSNDYNLEDGKTYVLIANGMVSPDGYEPNIPFDIHVFDMGREEATMMDQTDLLVFHGSTDAPTVDVVEVGAGAGTIIDDFMYGDFAGYLELPTADYVLEIRDETGSQTVVSYDAPLATLGLEGTAITVVASGFLNPDNNSNGEAFGLWVSLASGGELIPLPTTITNVTESFIDESSIIVYPNPANDFIHVNYDLTASTDAMIEIYNMVGVKVMSMNAEGSQQKIDVSDLESGMYILSLRSGEQSIVKKLSIN